MRIFTSTLFVFFFQTLILSQDFDSSSVSSIICEIKLNNNKDTNSFSGVLIDRNTFLSDVQIFQKIDTTTKFLGASNYKGAFDFKIINANYSELIFKKDGFYDFAFKRKKRTDSLVYFHKIRMILIEDISLTNFSGGPLKSFQNVTYKSGDLMSFKLNHYEEFDELEIENLKLTIKNNPKVKIEFYLVNQALEKKNIGRKRLKVLKRILKEHKIHKKNYRIDSELRTDKTISKAYIRPQIVNTFEP